jgi:L-alanine-DL-glutamate epimerase-like enolase superfamily enzyme
MSFVATVDTYIVTLPRDTPYLGPLAEGDLLTPRGYVVRQGNGTIYPTVDRSVVIRITTEDGAVGWGETYGLCAPKATCEIINELLGPLLVGRRPEDVETIWDFLYGLMRVRGAVGGLYGDALAAIDIALWDLRARARDRSIAAMLHHAPAKHVPCYLSGLPAATIDERVKLALNWRDKGVRSMKFASVVSHEGIALEFEALRAAMGKDVELMVDLHWKFNADEALAVARNILEYDPLFIEAPVKPEDHKGFVRVCAGSPVPVAAGEEWYSGYEFMNRRCPGLAFVQPEMAHTGITAFTRIAREAIDVKIAPHATIGIGIFLAASLQASSVLPNLWRHEWQHSVFQRNLSLLDTDMQCDGQRYTVPGGGGLGVTPNEEFWKIALHIK